LVILVFHDLAFFFRNIISVVFLCAVNRYEDIFCESFSVKFILHSSWYTPLVYVFCEPFFNVVFCVCSLFFFFLKPDVVNITWITGHIHISIANKINPTSEDVEMVKKYLFNYIGLHFFNMNRRIYLPCLQFTSKKYFWWIVTRTPPFLVQKWKNGLWWYLWWAIVY